MLTVSVDDVMLRNMLLRKYEFNLNLYFFKIKMSVYTLLLLEFICFPFRFVPSRLVCRKKSVDYVCILVRFNW